VYKHLRISVIALMSAALTVAPAAALSLNLGGDGPLLDLSNKNNSSATVSIDTNAVLGKKKSNGSSTTGGLLNLGSVTGSGSGSGGVVDRGNSGNLLNLGKGGLLDLNGNGDTQLDVILLGKNGLLDLDSSGSLLGIGLDSTNYLLDFGTTSGTGGRSGRLIDLGDSGGLLDLGNGEFFNLGGNEPLLEFGDDPLVALNLLGTNVDVQLGGKGKPLAKVTVGVDDDGVAGTGLLGGTGASVTIGSGSGGGSDGPDDPDDPDNPDNPDNPNNPNNPGNGNGGSGSALMASADACLSLTEAQLRELVNRHDYSQATFRSWAGTNSLKIVPVDLCEGVVSKVSMTVGGDANIARLQAFLGGQAKVRAGLAAQGYSAADVIAADRDGTVLVIYVM
jgi:hypothetical protein